MERKIIDSIIEVFKKSKYYEKDIFWKITVAILSSIKNIIDNDLLLEVSQFLEEYPKVISILPKKFKKEIVICLGITNENLDTIEYASKFGLL